MYLLENNVKKTIFKNFTIHVNGEFIPIVNYFTATMLETKSTDALITVAIPII